jgi:transcriptional regulator with AAA-type ATPase domain
VSHSNAATRSASGPLPAARDAPLPGGYAGPGNVRELRNVVERLLLLNDDEIDARAVRDVLSTAPS